MKKKVCLVTGGAGFIGSHMVDLLLAKNYTVRILDDLSGGHIKNIKHNLNNKNLSIEKKDITKISTTNKIFKNLDYVFHFAGKGDIVPSIENPKNYINTNLFGTVNILEGCRNSKIKNFIYAASSSCYGIAKTPTSENHPIFTLYPYALSKYQGEQATFHWSKVYKIRSNSIRIFNAYGPRVRTTGVYGAVFGVFFKQKLAQKPLTIVGNGKQKRDYIYVTDVADAFFKLGKSKYDRQIFNLGGGDPKTVNYLANLIGGNKIFIPKRPGEPDCTWADIKKIKKKLKWKPTVSFEEGVKEMLKEINNWRDAPLWNKKNIKRQQKIGLNI